MTDGLSRVCFSYNTHSVTNCQILWILVESSQIMKTKPSLTQSHLCHHTKINIHHPSSIHIQLHQVPIEIHLEFICIFHASIDKNEE